jgi:hypothetical protein
MAKGFGWRQVVVGLALLVPCLTLGSSAVRADDEPRKEEARPVIDKTQVYFGCASTCKAPAVVDADKVYRAIPEYKKILDQKLTEKDAEYSILLLRASKRFRSAVEGAATDAGNDLVANQGAVKWEGHTVPDLTDAALKKVADQKVAVRGVAEPSKGNP